MASSSSSSSLSPPAFQKLVLAFVLLLCYAVQPLHAGHSHLRHGHGHGHHAHAHFHQLHFYPKRNGSIATNGSSSMSLEEAQDIVSRFQKAMAQANAVILSNPRPNVRSLLNGSELQQTRQPAPPLDYADSPSGSPSNASSARRGATFRRDPATNQTVAGNSSFSQQAYSIPPEVVEASRVVAEASPPDSSAEDYAAMIASLKARFAPKLNDTNVMPQRMKRPSGLVQYVPPNELPLTTQNGSQVAGPPQVLSVRDSTTYWQETIPQLGESPFAPAGYKVWRNVMDYGAKGDGVTDDTAAIQLAISDGGRCGASCPSSSVYPATVYFPAGTYLVSSSITQYYNTELLGNPLDLPTIVASSSFVGLGVIGSDVYTGPITEWYLNTNNFLRSVRNFIIDIRATPQDAAVCGIHWQVAQGSSLENIYFYSTDPSDNPATTQQGIYMENGSGGFLGDLYFIGGKFGAFFGNQQFTASGLWFQNCQTGLQISWDWGWTMQNLVFENCGTGVIIVGGAGGPLSTGQGVGSLALTDFVMLDVQLGIDTSLYADNSTAFFMQNAAFDNVDTIVLDSHANVVLYPGSAGNTILVDSWGFGKVTDAAGETGFVNGANISTPTRAASLVLSDAVLTANQQFYFTRRRPSYATLGNSQLMDVKAWGAQGDGTSDDTAVLNHILDAAANMSAIVYFPFGVYVITDTLRFPVGSRIIGQAWPQIMATGAAFADPANPHVAVQVGDPGSVGAVEIQCMMFTVRGPTAGAVLVEWNVHESTQGSAGLWDSHFRVGGAAGTDLQASNCPVTSQSSQCVAASVLMHITQAASAYLENVWMWVADHDMDSADQTQINIFAARGILIESQGPSWLWGTAAEHAILYNYQLSGAQNVVMGLIQTESPYFQPSPMAPTPFSDGLVFANDPDFVDCAGSQTCAMSWAVRMIDSSTVYVLSTGLYTWFQDYDQTCVNDGVDNCQLSSFYVEQSFDIWIYNLITIGSIQMISPLNGNPIIAANNRNGFASSILAWLGGANQTAGSRNFTGYQLYTLDNLTNSNFPAQCQTALTATIKCADYTIQWMAPSYHGSLNNDTLQAQVCDPGCGQSLAAWYNGVNVNCAGYTWASGAPLDMFGGYIWYGYNETCQTDPTSDEFCNDIIGNFSLTTSLGAMPTSELCSACFLGRLTMMQQSAYSIFNVFSWFQLALQAAVSKCSLPSVPTTTQAPLIPVVTAAPVCVSGTYYTTQSGDSCNSVALAHSVSSASVFFGNPSLTNCTALPPGLNLCMPLTCQTYLLRPDDDCISASINAGILDITLYNSWINSACDNLQQANTTLGSVLCASPLGGTYVPGPATNTSSFPGSELTGYGTTLESPPPGVTVAPGTILMCGGWYVVAAGDVCANITLNYGIGLTMFAVANPSINSSDCSSSLIVGDAYCVAPLRPGTVAVPYSWKSFGCWANADPASHVVMDANFTDLSSMTVEECAEACIDDDYAFFGLEGSDQCFCGSEVTINSVQVSDAQCNLVCAGNSSETCGGSGGATSLFGPSSGVPLAFQYADLGCFADSAATPALTGGASLLAQSNNSVGACADFCLPAYPYFGVENGSDCWCGAALSPSAAPLNDSSCGTNCTGSAGELCGGSSAMEVYAARTSFTVSSTATSAPSSSASVLSTTSSSTATSTSVTSTSASASPTSSLPAYYAWGCYTEATNQRALSEATLVNYTAMTVEICANFCLVQQAQQLFGLEYGGECYCGDQLNAGSASVTSGNCNMACGGNAAEMCGAGNRLNVYGTSPPTATSTPQPPSYTSLGCYTEATDSRALDSASETDYTNMTVEMCAGYCITSLGYTLFGVEYGGECYCGNQLQAGSVAAPSSDCSMACDGNAAETCGGPNRLNVYQNNAS